MIGHSCWTVQTLRVHNPRSQDHLTRALAAGGREADQGPRRGGLLPAGGDPQALPREPGQGPRRRARPREAADRPGPEEGPRLTGALSAGTHPSHGRIRVTESQARASRARGRPCAVTRADGVGPRRPRRRRCRAASGSRAAPAVHPGRDAGRVLRPGASAGARGFSADRKGPPRD